MWEIKSPPPFTHIHTSTSIVDYYSVNLSVPWRITLDRWVLKDPLLTTTTPSVVPLILARLKHNTLTYQLHGADDHQRAPPVAAAHAFPLQAGFGPREAACEPGFSVELQCGSECQRLTESFLMQPVSEPTGGLSRGSVPRSLC